MVVARQVARIIAHCCNLVLQCGNARFKLLRDKLHRTLPMVVCVLFFSGTRGLTVGKQTCTYRGMVANSQVVHTANT